MNKSILYLFMAFALCTSFVCAAGAQTVTTSSPDSSAVRVTLLNQDPDPAVAGDTFELRFSVENMGTEAVSGIQFEVIQDYPFTVVSEPDISTGFSLNARQTESNFVNLKYTIKVDKEAAQGQQALQIRYKYGSQPWAVESFNVDIRNREFAQIIFIDKAKVQPGKETDLKFTITNMGNAPLQNLLFTWSEADGVILPVYSSNSKYIKYLEAGKSVDLTYTVIADVNADPGLYQLDLTLKSESQYNSTQSIVSTKAGIFIGGETDFDVTFSESSQGMISLSVANTGNNPAQSVSVRIPDQENFKVTGTNSAIIGSLDKGDYTLVSFSITSSAQAGNISASGMPGRQGMFNPQNTSGQQAQQQPPLNYTGQNAGRYNLSSRGMGGTNLRVLIDYTDTTGERKVVEKLVPIQFKQGVGTVSGVTASTGMPGRAGKAGITLSRTWLIVIGALLFAFVLFVFLNRSVREGFSNAFKKKRVEQMKR